MTCRVCGPTEYFINLKFIYIYIYIYRSPVLSRNTPGTHFCLGLSRLQGHSAVGHITSMKNLNYPIGNRTLDLPACSAVVLYVCMYVCKYVCVYIYICIYSGPGSSVGRAIDYGLGGPGSNPGEDEIFRSSRSALGPTQSPVKWVPSLSRG